MRLAEIARLVGGRLAGDPDFEVMRAASLGEAGTSDIAFAADSRAVREARTSPAGALVLESAIPGRNCVEVEHPRLAFARILKVFEPSLWAPLGVHPSAVVEPGSRVGGDCSFGAHVVVCRGAEIGDKVTLYPGVFVGSGSRIGDGTVVYPNAVIADRVSIGRGVVIHPGAVIGADGFGYAQTAGRHEKIPQIGAVVVEDEVEIGANTAVDRATMGTTVVGRGTKIDNLVQVGHNVVIGEDCAVAGCSAFGGSARIGKRCLIGGGAAIVDHATLGDGCVVAAFSLVAGDLPPGSVVSGCPARPHSETMRSIASARRVPELQRTIRRLEDRLRLLEARLGIET